RLHRRRHRARSIRPVRKFAVLLCAAVMCGGAAPLETKAAVDAPSAAPVPLTVNITNFAFSPKELVVEKGTTVRWTNHDGEPHTVVSSDDPKAFKSRALDDGDAYEFTFTEAGTFAYFCSVHPHMRGTIVVR